MSNHLLPVFFENAAYDVACLVPSIIASRAVLADVLALNSHYRIRGISDLFMRERPDVCLDCFHRGGRAYKQWLMKANENDKATGLGVPFFDAVASGDEEGARQIASLSRQTHNPDLEYEEDFLYLHYLMEVFYRNNGQHGEAVLTAYEDTLAQEDFRFDICLAFHAGDTELFEEAMARLWENHKTLYLKLANADTVEMERLQTEGHLCVEALALVILARRRGLMVQDHYPFIPSILREPISLAYCDHSWKTPEVLTT
ncbi:hypothetical protein EUZ85_17785 [Hahella sp. KA22]|uniref:Imm49 family immunity protein n=1 Tax=Hahella sp. KA22 TaxID=1628392 RepID=UPI000FDE29F2|nr:Imm49 family immunity protein [Hahella sp. KA22]AZZ92471.1 hypothetical protein ENC22_15210 [Hahella sp. KA22]QAY55845.1 hypothetical protein EUZ85_17785 [Hahella sp. KA22]